MDLTATLLDPNGLPIPNQQITFAAEFADATIIPGQDNQGAVFTDNNGQAQIILIAGLTTGRMRVAAEAPPGFNLSTALFVDITTQGFLSLGSLGIIPAAITFINPGPGTTADFQAMGGSPPYVFSNTTPSVGQIETLGRAGEIGRYTLTGPLPTAETEARQDEVILVDSAADQVTATVEALFVTCDFDISPQSFTFANALGGEQGLITIIDGAPPFTVTQSLPGAGSIEVNDNAMTVTFTVASPPLPAAPNTILIRDSRGCTATVEVTITTSLLTVTPASATLVPGATQQFVISGGAPPYQIAASGGTVSPTTVASSGGTFVYTAGTTPGSFTIVVTDQQSNVAQAQVTIQEAVVTVSPLTVTPASATLVPGATQPFVVTGGVPPYQITASGGTASPTTVETSGGTFVYTAGTTAGSFTVVVTDQQSSVVQAEVTIQ
jgi:hypothetical protein